jgi:hypothetical protein
MLVRLLAHLNLPKPQVYLVYDPYTKKSSIILKLKFWLGVSLMMTVMLTRLRPTFSLQLVTELPGSLQLTSLAHIIKTT